MEARILIVEDDALIALHLEQLVESTGHSVAGIAMDPAEACAIAQVTRPHLALIDIRLRDGTSGLDAARYLRESCNVPAIFVSANLDAQTRTQAQSLRPLAFIGKPFFPADVTDAIHAAVAQISARPDT